MRYLLSLLFVASSLGSAHAFDLTTQSLIVGGYASSMVTSAPFDRKLIVAARDDAALFVVSEGRLRTVRLEAALRQARSIEPKLRASDLELAQAILVK
ncbi:hypothetical protein D3C76_1429210 [compost metagenome]